MSSLEEIRSAVARLPAREKTLLAAELFASEAMEPNLAELGSSLQGGLDDLRAGRVRPIEAARSEISEWITKS